MFVLGVFTMVTRRNAIYVLMGAELILNAAALNFVAFARHLGNRLDGQMFAIFIVILAAAEAAVALGIVLQIHHHFRPSTSARLTGSATEGELGTRMDFFHDATP